MKKLLIILTGLCIVLYVYLAYLGESVEAWTVIPWMVVVLFRDIKDYWSEKNDY